MGHGEENHQNLAISELGRIEDDADAFGVSGVAGTNGSVIGGFGRAASIAGGSGKHAAGVFENGLYPPETAAGKDRDFLAAAGGDRIIHGRSGECVAGPGRRKRRQRGGEKDGKQKSNATRWAGSLPHNITPGPGRQLKPRNMILDAGGEDKDKSQERELRNRAVQE